jgi:hypothetical protein
MTVTELARREARADRDVFVIARNGDGCLVYSPANPKQRYRVSEDEDGVHCTCPDFQAHQNDPGWRCKHILAALRQADGNGHARDPYEAEERRAIQEESREPRKRKAAPPSPAAQMLLKRSVSPDGRIDSLSVEFATPVSDITGSAVKTQAAAMLAIQSEIVDDFLHRSPKSNGPLPNGNGQPAEEQKSPASPARVVGVGGMDGKWGRRLFLTIEADGKRLRLFGNRKQLGEHLTMAGYPDIAHTLSEGADLDLPCRVITKPSTDGGYINIERLLPASGQVRS